MKIKTIIISGLLMLSFTSTSFADMSPKEYKEFINNSFSKLNSNLPEAANSHSLIRYGVKEGYLKKEIDYLSCLHYELSNIYKELIDIKVEGSIYNGKHEVLIKDIEEVISSIEHHIKAKSDVYNSDLELVRIISVIISSCDPDVRSVNKSIEKLNKTYKEINSLGQVY